MSPFSGVHDPHLDSLLNQATAALSLNQRCTMYNQAASYIAQKYYGPFYFAYAPANVAVKNVMGPGVTQPLPTAVFVPKAAVLIGRYRPATRSLRGRR